MGAKRASASAQRNERGDGRCESDGVCVMVEERAVGAAPRLDCKRSASPRRRKAPRNCRSSALRSRAVGCMQPAPQHPRRRRDRFAAVVTAPPPWCRNSSDHCARPSRGALRRLTYLVRHHGVFVGPHDEPVRHPYCEGRGRSARPRSRLLVHDGSWRITGSDDLDVIEGANMVPCGWRYRVQTTDGSKWSLRFPASADSLPRSPTRADRRGRKRTRDMSRYGERPRHAFDTGCVPPQYRLRQTMSKAVLP